MKARLFFLGGILGLLAAAPLAALGISPTDTGHYAVAGLERTGVIVVAWPDQPNGRAAGALVSWYTYDPLGPTPTWLLSDVIDQGDDWVPVQICSGEFPGLFAECDPGAGEMRLRKRAGQLILDYALPVFGGPECDPRPKVSPLPAICQGTLRLERLTPPVTQ